MTNDQDKKEIEARYSDPAFIKEMYERVKRLEVFELHLAKAINTTAIMALKAAEAVHLPSGDERERAFDDVIRLSSDITKTLGMVSLLEEKDDG